jgi:hypothetical protein
MEAYPPTKIIIKQAAARRRASSTWKKSACSDVLSVCVCDHANLLSF